VAGAGNALYIDAFAERIGGATLQDKRLKGDDPRVVFEDALEHFHRYKVDPYNDRPEDERPDFWVVLGFSNGKRARLYESHLSALVERYTFAVTGTGAIVAYPILVRFERAMPQMRFYEAVLLASYIVYQSKEAVKGVGKDTQIRTLTQAGRDDTLIPDTQRKLDDLMRQYADVLEPLVFRSAVGILDPEIVSRRVQDMREAKADLMRHTPYRAVTPSPPAHETKASRPVRRSPTRGRKVRPPSRE